MNQISLEQLIWSVYWQCEKEIKNNDYAFDSDVEKYLSEVLHRGIYPTSSSKEKENATTW
jgi:hypothetical protein